jgi:hypothetical protein
MTRADHFSGLSREDLISRLLSAESLISEQRRLLQAKESMLQKYIQQFTQLTADYERMIDSRYPSERAPTDEIQEVPAPGNRRRAQETFQVDPPDPLLGRRALQSQISFGVDDPLPVKRLPNLPRSAMDDHFNIPVGENEGHQAIAVSALEVDTTGMTVDQMRAKVDELNIEKAALERQLNKVLPKGKVMAHVIREREEIEGQFNELARVIARIKLEIRRATAS